MIKRLGGFFLKWLIGLALLLLSAALVIVAAHALMRVSWLGRETTVFFSCFIAYFLIHWFLYQPVLSHVMAHEITHALASLVTGGRVTAIHATTTGGSTITNRSHIFVSLAPYVFPLYTAAALGLYFIAAPSFKIYLLGLVGFTYAFHLALTVYSLSHQQPDLKEGGKAFSLLFIFAGNMIVLVLLIAFVWPHALSLKQAALETYHWAQYLALAVYRFLKPHFFRPEGTLV
jgi:hypothetical protein